MLLLNPIIAHSQSRQTNCIVCSFNLLGSSLRRRISSSTGVETYVRTMSGLEVGDNIESLYAKSTCALAVCLQ